MSEIAESIREASLPKGGGASEAARELAEAEAEAELSAALDSKDPKRIRAAMKAIRELDD